MDAKAFLMEVETTGFNVRNSDHLSALQSLIHSGAIWEWTAPWRRFARRMIALGIVSP